MYASWIYNSNIITATIRVYSMHVSKNNVESECQDCKSNNVQVDAAAHNFIKAF